MTLAERSASGTAGAAPRRKLYWFWWLVGTAVWVAAALPWVFRKVRWRALLGTIAVFVVLIFASEIVAVHQGWWVWNEALLLGPKVLGVPLEEFLLYFFVVPAVVVIQHLLERLLGSGKENRHA
jgi:lycopene cyclase domain-containing protein